MIIEKVISTIRSSNDHAEMDWAESTCLIGLLEELKKYVETTIIDHGFDRTIIKKLNIVLPEPPTK